MKIPSASDRRDTSHAPDHFPVVSSAGTAVGAALAVVVMLYLFLAACASGEQWIAIAIVVLMSCGGLCSYVAGVKGYPKVTWLLGGFALGPLALIALCGLPTRPGE